MPHETEILFNESGIQYQGVNDASGGTGAYPIQGLIVGQFKRGRLDKPMTIHRDNIKAMLGYEPQNPCYTAVQDVLGTGVPSIEVLRINKSVISNPGNGAISCAGATSVMTLVMAYKMPLVEAEIMPIMMGAKVTINDVTHNFFETLTSGQYFDTIQESNPNDGTQLTLPEGYFPDWQHLANITKNTLRLNFDFTENNPNSSLILTPPTASPYDNFSYYQGEDKRILEVCVKAGEPVVNPPDPLPPLPNPNPENRYFRPFLVTHDGAYLYGDLGDSIYGIYALNGNSLDLSHNLMASSKNDDRNYTSFSKDSSLLLRSGEGKSLSRSNGENYDVNLMFDPPVNEPALKRAIGANGDYILTANMNQAIQIYKRQTQATYKKIGQLSEADYFTSLCVSPNGDKFSYVTTGSADLKVFSFENGNVQLIGMHAMTTNAQYDRRTIGNAIWMHSDIIMWSYTWDISDDEKFKGFLDIIKVTAHEVTLGSRKEDLGPIYYRFQPPQNGRVLATTNLDEVRLLDVNSLGTLTHTRSYPELKFNQNVLLPNGNIATNGSYPGQVDIINVI
ncbi:hypothetical protein J2X86_002516 [Acinetobacter lwoffii]|uniref:WD40 repeat domain-containing protein n=2 Tax=Acinetobacter lwoffii TaxID=28090 RepID=A0AAW8LL36_ACILW|nr:WD40 repeat domain-containing protein [Acinetobacter lwoffii]MDR6630461.1 hypothetical protein [Acinetobacter lwoffii]